MVLTRPEKAWRYAALCTLASVLGGLLGAMVVLFYFISIARIGG